jgi:sulfur carrier protein
VQLTVNGKAISVEQNVTLEKLLQVFDISMDIKGVAVAVNEEVVAKQEWASTFVKAGDNIEIIHAVQGG